MNTIDKLLVNRKGEVWTVSPEASVLDAIKMLKEKSVGALPVVSGTELVGIISERDYTRKIILEGRTSKDTKVKDIMTANVFHAKPTQRIEECMAVMTDNHFRHLPIVESGKLMGMITIGDVVKYIISDQQFKIEQLEQNISWGESY